MNNGLRFDVINIEDPQNPHRVGRFELDTPGHAIHDIWIVDGIAYTSNLAIALALAAALPGQAASQSYWVYVAAESEDEVALLRYDAGGDLVVEKTITTGWLPAEIEAPHGLAVDPGGQYWYLTLGHGFPTAASSSTPPSPTR